jgi:preprotein translocase subunit SecG
MSIVIGIFTFVLILLSLFLVLVVLAQKAKDGGVGAALGGGATEAAFGAETGNVLSKATINGAIAFFVLSFLLYLGHIYQRGQSAAAGDALPAIEVPAAPAAPTEAATGAPTTLPLPAAPGTDAATPAAAGALPTPAPAPADSTKPTP